MPGIYAESSPSTNTTSIPTGHTDPSAKPPRYEHSPSPPPPTPRSSDVIDSVEPSTNTCRPRRAAGFRAPTGLAGIFRPVIQILRLKVLNRASNPASRRLVAAQLVGDHYPWHVLQALEQLAKEPGRGLGVPPRGDQNAQDIPVLVDSAPQVPAADR